MKRSVHPFTHVCRLICSVVCNSAPLPLLSKPLLMNARIHSHMHRTSRTYVCISCQERHVFTYIGKGAHSDAWNVYICTYIRMFILYARVPSGRDVILS